MITIFYTPLDNYVNPIEALVNYTGLRSRCRMVAMNPYQEWQKLAPHTPITTVPTGLDEDGTPYYGGPILYEFLDGLHDKPKLFPPGPDLIFLRRQLWLADGMFDQFARVFGESMQPPENRRPHLIARQWKKTLSGFDVLDQDAKGWTRGLDIAQLRAVCTIIWIETRMPEIGAQLHPFGIKPDFDWRDGRPTLAAWYARWRPNPIFSKIEADQ